MTLAAACGWSLVRSLVVALIAWPICKRQSFWLQGMDHRLRRQAWILLMIPFLCPELWTGYAWSGFALRLAGTEFWRFFPASLFPSPQAIVARDAAVDELLLDLLLLFRALPVGTLAVYFAPPPPLSAAAIHCRNLAIESRMGFQARPSFFVRTWMSALRFQKVQLGWLRFALQGNWHTALPALALMFLVSFQNFELASLLGRPAWTVWLFDAQVGGLALHESLRLVILPVVCQIVVFLPIASWILTSRSPPSLQAPFASPISRRCHSVLWGLLFVSVAVTIAVPAILVGRATLEGLDRIFQDAARLTTLLKEILVGSTYALVAAVASALVASKLLQRARISWLARGSALMCSLPGLFGSLVLSLALIHLLQKPYVHVLYKTPPALALGLALFLLPRAMALRFLLWSSRRRAGAHLATLLGESSSVTVRDAGRELNWQLKRRAEFWGVGLLAYWAYLELTIAYLLAPVSIVSAPVMLYNQMHFGKNATLSALVVLTVLVPALIFVLAAISRSFLFRWFWR